MTDMRGASRNERRHAAKYLAAENAKYPPHLIQVEVPANWDRERGGMPPVEIWRSMFFLVQIYAVTGEPKMERMSVNRTALEKSTGEWSQNISWEDLQVLKHQCGRGDMDAVEIYPRASDTVNVANMRHLWIFTEGRIPFAWRKRP